MVQVSVPLNTPFQTAALPKFYFMLRSQEKPPEWTQRGGEGFKRLLG